MLWVGVGVADVDGGAGRLLELKVQAIWAIDTLRTILSAFVEALCGSTVLTYPGGAAVAGARVRIIFASVLKRDFLPGLSDVLVAPAATLR